MRRALVCIAILAVFATTAAMTGNNGEICGVVKEAETGKPIAYANVVLQGTSFGAMTAADGKFCISNVPPGKYAVKVMMMGFKVVELPGVLVKPDVDVHLTFKMTRTIVSQTQEIVVKAHADPARTMVYTTQPLNRYVGPMNTESYARIYENEFRDAFERPFSTFSIDVDAASYANTRRFINSNMLPPPGAVRIEEFINYFKYDYPEPEGEHPFSITAEVADCPWNDGYRLVHIGLQGRHVKLENLPASNLVFLLDVSGSMQPPNKLPLLRRAFRLLAENLRDEDRVAIVVYAGSSGLVLPSTPGSHRKRIIDAIERLQAGGSTAGAAGIRLAYQVAEENFVESGNNRVILATDGDFNVGVTNNSELIRMIEEKRESGVYLSVLGFGEGNLKDDRMEQLADKGNGNYNYIDSLDEARRVLVGQMAGTLFTIAKDVKIQLEFNPTRVESYRLIGYENRVLEKKDFDDDKKDAGELGSGHSVTALYEVVPAERREISRGDGGKYMVVSVNPGAYDSKELLTLRQRYKPPESGESRLIETTLRDAGRRFEQASRNMRFSAAVAEFGMLLRDSEFKGSSSLEHVLETAESAAGDGEDGDRKEFIELAKTCRRMAER